MLKLSKMKQRKTEFHFIPILIRKGKCLQLNNDLPIFYNLAELHWSEHQRMQHHEYCWRKLQHSHQFQFPHLTRFVFQGFYGEKNETDTIKCILKNASVLKKVNSHCGISYDMKILQGLSSFQRATSVCQLEFFRCNAILLAAQTSLEFESKWLSAADIPTILHSVHDYPEIFREHIGIFNLSSGTSCICNLKIQIMDLDLSMAFALSTPRVGRTAIEMVAQENFDAFWQHASIEKSCNNLLSLKR
ncbi:FBD domain [Dillenia turbinata]|uniref:FBD domain n=1 Tax=Dillenia turbinata TaxID=194707 RepID=A0AAN8VQW0_9MAGN